MEDHERWRFDRQCIGFAVVVRVSYAQPAVLERGGDNDVEARPRFRKSAFTASGSQDELPVEIGGVAAFAQNEVARILQVCTYRSDWIRTFRIE